MTRVTAVLLALSLLMLPGCFGGPSEGWHKKGFTKERMDIDRDNCVWEATHKDNGDGTVTLLTPSDEELEAAVGRCMKDNGYAWGVPEDKD
ncbi:hypothetical protein [Desulfocurvus sp. DL9XJH121]